MALQHNGITVAFDEQSAKFTATVNGKKVTAPSFDAMKRQIDKVNVFKSFKILILPRYSGHRMEEDEVIGLGRRSRGYGRGRAVFKCKRKDEFQEVIEDTPDNRKRIAALMAMQNEHAKILEAHNEAERKAAAAIPRRHADKEAGEA